MQHIDMNCSIAWSKLHINCVCGVCVCVCACSILHIMYDHIARTWFNTLCVPSGELIGLPSEEQRRDHPLMAATSKLYAPSHADHSSSDFTTSTLLHCPGWRRRRFWMGKWLSKDSEMNDILLDWAEIWDRERERGRKRERERERGELCSLISSYHTLSLERSFCITCLASDHAGCPSDINPLNRGSWNTYIYV